MIRNNNFNITKLQETTENSDLKTIFVDNQKQCLNEIIKNYHINDSDKVGNDSDISYNIQIISPLNKGDLGIKEINKSVQEKFNKNKDNKKKLNANGYSFYEDDKVMYLKNQGDLSNGDIGVIKSISIGESKSEINALFNKKEIQLNNADLSNLALCYACTVHKTQGSEFQKVILVLDPEISGSFINKKLVYTAITRAKKELVIITSEQSFIKSINQRPAKRDTTLTEAIRLMYRKKEK
nr:ATP-dependent RecD-like DNA helicase [Mycoplasmopsis bovis]